MAARYITLLLGASFGTVASSLDGAPLSEDIRFAARAVKADTIVPGLADYARAAGRYFGTATDLSFTTELQDYYYMKELNNTRDYVQLTPGNIMKWAYTEPQQGVFDYTAADQFVALAKANGQIIRCHNLNWYNQNPNWLTDGTWTNATLLAALENHITNLVTHFGNDCYHWDVVNEALSDAGGYRPDIWYNTTGDAFIYTAFAAAEAAVKKNNLSTKLYYNDYNIESASQKSTEAQQIVKNIKARGIQIDGVGLQGHFIVGSTPSTAQLVQNMNDFVALGVEVALTELDIRTTLPATPFAEYQQSIDYMNTVNACKQVSKCVGVTIWDFDDTYSWIPGTFAGQGYADVFEQPQGKNTTLFQKPAYDGIISGWNVSITTPLVGTTSTTSTTSTMSTSSSSTIPPARTASPSAATTTTAASSAASTLSVSISNIHAIVLLCLASLFAI